MRAPGRVNLIGGHTEYNGGYVLSLNINRHMLVALRARDDSRVVAYSEAMDEVTEFDLKSFQRTPGQWGEYVQAAAWALADGGHALRGWEGVIASDIPMKAGMGASAALLMCMMAAFATVSGLSIEPEPLARLAHHAEIEWLEHYTGLSDVLSVSISHAGEGVLVDEQARSYEVVPLPRTAKVLLLQTGAVPDVARMREIAQSRLEETASVVRSYRVNHLRDLSMSRFEKDGDDIDDDIFNRAKHILTENGRAILAAEMLRSGAVATVGRLMNDSHVSLRDNYGIPANEADTMLNCVMEQPNVLGARAAGSGSGELTVALVQDISAQTVSQLVSSCYKRTTQNDANVIIVEPVAGLEVL